MHDGIFCIEICWRWVEKEHFAKFMDFNPLQTKMKWMCKSGMRQNYILIHVFLSWSMSFLDPCLFFSYFNCLPDDVLCKIAIWADDNALNSSCDKPSDLTQQVVIWSWKYENALVEISENANLHVDLKPRILIASLLLAPLLNN